MKKNLLFILAQLALILCCILISLLIFVLLIGPQLPIGPVSIIIYEKELFEAILRETHNFFTHFYLIHTLGFYILAGIGFIVVSIQFIRLWVWVFPQLPLLALQHKKALSVLLLFFVLVALLDCGLFVAEYFDRKSGYYPGSQYRWNDFSIANPNITHEVIADENGMTVYDHDSFPRKGYAFDFIVNKQGFPIGFDFDRKTIDSLAGTGLGRKKKRLVLGDSFVEGIGASRLRRKFMSICSNNNPDQVICAAGIRGTDPTDYKLYAKKLIPMIAPDEVCIMFCGWNDVIVSDRKKIIPYIPLFTNINGVGCIYNYISPGIAGIDTLVLPPQESYKLYRKKFSLMDNTDILSRICRRTAVTTRLYSLIHQPEFSKQGTPPDSSATYRQLKAIKDMADSAGAQFTIIFIPTPDMESYDLKAYEYHYRWVFKELWPAVHFCPKGMITLKDCVSNIDYHFNDRGQERFADFLQHEWLKK